MSKRNLVVSKNKTNLRLYITLIGVLVLGVFIIKVFSMFFTKNYADSVQFVYVPAPKTFIPAGTELTADKFEMVKVPGQAVNEQIVTDMKTFKNVQTKVDLLAGQPVKFAALAPVAKVKSALQEKIPEGMRAMTLSVDPTNSVEGWALPGSVVDILLVKKDGKTQLVAEKVKILSLGGQLEGNPSSPSNAKTITVLVTQEQALAIASAQPLGKLAFTLRAADDEHTWQITQFDPSKIGSNKTATSRVEGVVKFKDASGKEVSYTVLDGKLIPVEEKKE